MDPWYISNTEPIKPNMTPEICLESILKRQKPIPISKVAKGVNEFNMAAKALSISVCAQANKKGGINETYPVIAIHFHLFLGIVFI